LPRSLEPVKSSPIHPNSMTYPQSCLIKILLLFQAFQKRFGRQAKLAEISI